MRRPIPPLATLTLAALAAGCAGTTYSQLDGRRYHATSIDTYPVAVVKVDGLSTPLRNPVYVDPGRHEITVQGPPGGARGYGAQRTITLDVLPCTRYWLVAVKPGPLASDFTVKVDHQEALGGCVASVPPAG